MLKRKYAFEFAIYIAILLVIWRFSLWVDAVDKVIAFLAVHEEYEVDEIIPSFLAGVVCLAIFAWRRMRESITAEDRIRQAESARTGFLSNLNHEIRTPLNGMLGMLQILKHTQLDKEQTEYVEICEKSTNRLYKLLTGMLDIVACSSEHIDISRRHVNLAALMKATADAYLPQAQQKHLTIAVENCDEPAVILSDERYISKALAYLMDNAIKFTEEGGVILSLHRPAKGGVRLKIQDTGVGMPPDVQKIMTEAFVQGSEGTSRNYEGLGIGLSIALHAVSVVKGELSCQSKVGEGSMFDITLPAKI